MVDHRQITLGTVTNLGTVKHIYGGDMDWIFFLDEKNELRNLINPESSSGIFITENLLPLAKKLNLKAFDKLDKAQILTNIDILASCCVTSIYNQDKLNEMFQPYRDFISNTKATKTVIGRGPRPQHIVYINSDNDVAWEIREDAPSHMLAPLARLTDIKQVSKRILPKFIRKHASTTIGSAALEVTRSGLSPDENLIHTIENSVDNAIRDVIWVLQTYNAARYSLTLLLFLLAPILWIYILGFNNFNAGVTGGIIGSLLSSFQRSKGELTRQSYFTLLLQAFSRVILGAVYGLIVVILSKSGLALGLFVENIYALFIFGVIAGFAERWIPESLLGIAKTSANKD